MSIGPVDVVEPHMTQLTMDFGPIHEDKFERDPEITFRFSPNGPERRTVTYALWATVNLIPENDKSPGWSPEGQCWSIKERPFSGQNLGECTIVHKLPNKGNIVELRFSFPKLTLLKNGEFRLGFEINDGLGEEFKRVMKIRTSSFRVRGLTAVDRAAGQPRVLGELDTLRIEQQ